MMETADNFPLLYAEDGDVVRPRYGDGNSGSHGDVEAGHTGYERRVEEGLTEDGDSRFVGEVVL